MPHEGIVYSTCDRGHFTACVSQQQLFEVLSEIAIQAIIDGYFRESVASFASALERTYEFYVKVVCYHNQIDHSAFDEAWKPLSKQSERQIGAFSMCFLFENKYACELLESKAIEFRNRVIHQGLIPNRDESIKFAQAVMDCILPVLIFLKSERYSDAVNHVTSELIAERSRNARIKGAQVSVVSGSSPFSLGSGLID